MTCNGRSNMFVTELVIERTTAVTSERYAHSTKCVVEERPDPHYLWPQVNSIRNPLDFTSLAEL